MFQRILIANRGEIALRILRACKDLGIETIAVYSTADKGAPYLAFADRAVCIGPPPAAESYLKYQRIIAAADQTNVDAIHPGYGFLSENADFAGMCRDCNIEFIGPPQEAMRGWATRTPPAIWPRRPAFRSSPAAMGSSRTIPKPSSSPTRSAIRS